MTSIKNITTKEQLRAEIQRILAIRDTAIIKGNISHEKACLELAATLVSLLNHPAYN
jgi:hypothetical protein